MQEITDEQMNALLATAKVYTLVILRPGPNHQMAGADKIVWEHGRRNMELRAAGSLAIVCPVGSADISGVGIFDLDLDHTREVIDGDPGVRAGVFVAEYHPTRGFPGDSLP